MAAVGDQLHLGAEDVSLSIKAHVPAVVKTVAAAGDHEIVVAIQAQLDRAAQAAGGQAGHAGEQGRLRFLAAKAAAHAPALHLHLVAGPAQGVAEQLLHFAGVLGRAVDEQAAVFLGQGVADLAF